MLLDRKYFIRYIGMNSKLVSEEMFYKCLKDVTEEERNMLEKEHVIYRGNIVFFIKDNWVKTEEDYKEEERRREEEEKTRREIENRKRRDLRPLIKHCLCDERFLNGFTPSNEKYYLNKLDITEEQKDKLYKTVNDLIDLMKEVRFVNVINTDIIDIMKEDINFLAIPMDICRLLYRKDIQTIEELCNKTYLDILGIKRMGEIKRKQLIEAMKIYNLHFKEED